LWEACRDQIKAAIALDNEERAEAYETYRQACAQGTATPPS
jgi:hypothetical protein